MQKDLLDFQLGVSSPGGVEPIIFQVEKSWKEYTDTNSNTNTSQFTGVGFVDLANAFNNISRSTILESIKKYNPQMERLFRWSYGTSTPLIVDADPSSCTCLYCKGFSTNIINKKDKNNIVWSSQGVRQGDPLGPYLFSLGFRKILQDISSDKVKILTYLDDMTILCQNKSDYDEILSKLNSAIASEMGIHVNLDKSSYHHFADIKDQDNQYNCIELLGSCIGSKHNRGKFLRNKIDILISKVDKLKQLTSQEGFLLLSHCLIHELKHLQRILESKDNLPEWNRLDSYLTKYIKGIRGGIDSNDDIPATKIKNIVNSMEIHNRTYYENIIINLPLRYGGLGIPNYEKTLDIIRASALECDQARKKLTSPILTKHTTSLIIPAQNSNITITNSTSLSEQPTEDFDPKNKAKIKMNELYESQLTRLFHVMDDQAKTEFVDLNSKISKSWIYKTAIPNNLYRLSNKEVSSYLKAKTLYQEGNFCFRCGIEIKNNNNSNLLFVNSFSSHTECCTKNENFRVARHEMLKKSLARTLSKSNKVTIEPFINKNSSGLRADLSVAGPAAINGTLNLIDVSVVSLNSTKALKIKMVNNSNNNNTYNYKEEIENIKIKINDILDARHQTKINTNNILIFN